MLSGREKGNPYSDIIDCLVGSIFTKEVLKTDLTVTKQKAIFDEYMKAFKDNYILNRNEPYTSLVNALTKVVSDNNLDIDVEAECKLFFDAIYIKDYKTRTMPINLAGGNLYVPPFLDEFYNRSFAIKNCSGLYQLPISYEGNTTKQLNADTSRLLSFNDNFKFRIKDTQGVWSYVNSNTKLDRAGVSELYKYLSTTDMLKVERAFMNNPDIRSEYTWTNKDVSLGILKRLREEGFDYHIKLGGTGIKGHALDIDIVLDDNGITIPIYKFNNSDSNTYSNYVFDSNKLYRYSTSSLKGSRVKDYTNPDVDDMMDLIYYALGKDITTRNGEVFNKYMKEPTGRYTLADKEVNTSYVNSTDGTTIALRDLDDSNNGALTIMTSVMSKSATVNFDRFELEKQVDNAKVNITKQVFDYWLTGAFSDDKFIVSLQQKMIDSNLSYDSVLEIVSEKIGNYTPGESEPSLDPILLCKYMNADLITANRDALVKFFKSEQITGTNLFSDDKFRLNAFKNDLLNFDRFHARSLRGASPFFTEVANVLEETFNTTGYDVLSMRIDDNGIIEYNLVRSITRDTDTKNSAQSITGYLGQIFEPDDLGVIKTKYATDNYVYVPGYDIKILANKDGENLDLYDRLRLSGYKQRLFDALRYNVRSNFSAVSAKKQEDIDMSTSLNKLYGHLYSERYPADFLDTALSISDDEEFTKDLIKTIASRASFPKLIAKESGVVQKLQGDQDKSIQKNDRLFSYFALTGFRNMGVYDTASDGYFDPIATVTASSQLRVRYLVDSAKVDADGKLVRGDVDDRVPLLKHPYFKHFDYDTFDRIQMTFSNLLQSVCVTKEPVGIAQMCAGGFNMDDGMVISKDFAEKYALTVDGERRPLSIGDKISDLHGNKGVISLIVDRDSDIDDSSIRSEITKIFKDNPGLDIMMSPFSPVSRCNAGLAREIMANGVHEDIVVNGDVKVGALGKARVLITDKVIEHAVNLEDGRNSSSQLGWVLRAMGAGDLFHSFYNYNIGAFDYASYLSVMGLRMDINSDTERFGDISKYGGFKQPYQGDVIVGADANSGYYSFMPKPRFRSEDENGNPLKKDGKVVFDAAKVRADFEEAVKNGCKVLLVPFAITMPAGGKLLPSKKYKGFYELPVLKSNLMNSVTLDDGVMSMHRYMKYYTDIAVESARYVYAQNKGYAYSDMILKAGELTQSDIDGFMPMLKPEFKLPNYRMFANDELVNRYDLLYDENFKGDDLYIFGDINSGGKNDTNTIMASARSKIESSYRSITLDIQYRYFDAKHNFAKDGIMKNTVRDSATTLWVSDPELSLDKVAVSSKIAEELKLNEGDLVATWRDPLLHKGGARALYVTVNPDIDCIAINPAIAPSYEGDFDGDKIAIAKIQNYLKALAVETISGRANMLNTSLEKDNNGKYDLYYQNDLDIAVARYNNPELTKKFNDIRDKVNAEYAEYESKLNDWLYSDDAWIGDGQNKPNGYVCSKELFSEYDGLIGECCAASVGASPLSYTDVKSHIQSVYDACIKTGAKGNVKKLREYMYYLGVSDGKDSGDIDFDNIVDHGSSFRERQDIMDTQVATTVKTTMVGLSGRVSQVGAEAFGKHIDTLSATLNVNAPVTQSVIQAKKDADEAMRKAHIVLNVIPHFLDGVKVTKVGDKWQPVVNEETGDFEYYDTGEEWVKAAKEFYFDKEGVNIKVNTDCFKLLAHYMENVVEDPNSDDWGYISFDNTKRICCSNLDFLAYEKNFNAFCRKIDDLTANGKKFNLFDDMEVYRPDGAIGHIIDRNKMDLDRRVFEDSYAKTIDKFYKAISDSFTGEDDDKYKDDGNDFE